MASSTTGVRSSERWSLGEAFTALRQSLALAVVPGLIWVAGFYYPSLNLNVDLLSTLLGMTEEATGIEIPGGGRGGEMLGLFAPRASFGWPQAVWIAILLPLLLALSRWIVGLARVCDPRLVEGREASASALESGILSAADLERGRPQRLRTAWRAGKGLGLQAVGLWTMLVGMQIGAGLLVLGPVFYLLRRWGLEEVSGLLEGLLLLPILLLLLYVAALVLLNQLALHSLAHNRRGLSSALTHAWRLVRASPRGALRAASVDFLFAVAVLAAHKGIAVALGSAGLGTWPSDLSLLALYAFAGVVRAGYWARAYRGLGGLSAGDLVPGLSS